MKNNKILSIDQGKKQIALTGTLLFPLRPGERAWIRQGSHTVSTSLVKQILEVTADGIVFETCNTIYTVVCTTLPVESEVMCA